MRLLPRNLLPARVLLRLLLRLLPLLLTGPGLHGADVDLIPAGTPWRLRPGTTEASTPDTTAWRALGFDDATWATGPLPLFYGEALSGTPITGMQNVHSSYFLRRRFAVANPADLSDVTLHAACDDGFIAWLNGREIARFNVPAGEPAFNGLAIEPVAEPVELEPHLVANPATVLQAGDNVLAVQVFNATLGSSDLVFNARLSGVIDEEPPVLTGITPAAGAQLARLLSINLTFSERVRGVDAADLLLNGVAATNVVEFGPGQFEFTFAPPGPGPVTVTFGVGHGITDRSGAALPFAGASWQYVIDPATAPTSVIISEFLADNQRGIRDEDGDRSDWIELHNTTRESLSLGGWSLTDNATQLRKWVLPPVVLPGNGYLLVWASEKNRTNVGAALHSNFRLSNAGEFLALVTPTGEMASAFTPSFPPQRDDVSYGRVEGAPGVVGYFTTPTPGKPNSQGGPGFAPEVVFSERSRTYAGNLEVRLAFSTNSPVPPGAVIRFTLDGSLPSETSPSYAAPLRFTNLVAQVRARAFAPGLLPGEPRSETFIPLTLGVSTFRSDLPVLVIHNFNQGRPPANSPQPAHIQVFEPGTNGLTSFTNPPALAARAAIRARGSSTEGLPKVSLRVEFQDEFGNDLDRSILGLPAEADWVLYAPNNMEPSLIHNPFMHQLSRDLGRYSPRTRFCEVYLATSGTNAVSTTSYNGIYVLMERIEIGGDRVDAGNLTPDDLTPPRVTGGYMMKIDRLDPGDGGLTAGGVTVGLVEPRESELELPARAPQLNYLRNYLNGFAAALNGGNYRDPVLGYRAWVNVDSWIDHHLLNVLAFNVDALRLSAYFYKPRNGRLEFGPLWDFDRALGSNDGRDANPRVWRSTVPDFGTDFFNYPWWGRMFTDPDFYQRYIDRYHELRRAQFSTTNLWRLADTLSGQVRQAQPRELNRWGVQPRGGTYAAEIARMKAWLSNRVSFMDSQFVPPPAPGSRGGTVPRGHLFTLSAPTNVTIWYTLDGTDPRLPGGAVSGFARAYTGPLVVNTNTRVIFRGRNAVHTALTGANNPPLVSTWSGIQVLPLITDPLPLVISEIQFNPAGSVEFDPDDHEFVELLNRGSAPVNLAGCRIEGGISFNFAPTNAVTRLEPGARLVLAENLAAFRSRYPAVTNVAGQYEGRLNNAGDLIRLVGPLGETVVEVNYSPAWLGTAAVAGRALVPFDEAAPVETWNQMAAWVPSAALNGSPGAPDPASTGGRPMLQLVQDGPVLTLQFPQAAGRIHDLESAPSPMAPAWTLEQSFAPVAVPGTAAATVSAGETVRFFRVRVRLP